MLVGEAWGAEEERTGRPFQGASGMELNRMLQEAGILRAEVYVSNLINARPPDNDLRTWIAEKKKDITSKHIELMGEWVLPIVAEGYQLLSREIALVQPNVIIPVGNASTWALTQRTAPFKGITKWRGSCLRLHDNPDSPKVIPTIHPAAVLRQWDQRSIVVQDFKRAAGESGSRVYANRPAWRFLVRPSFETVRETLQMLLDALAAARLADRRLWIELDLETRAGHIACAGLSWSLTEALCIPFMCVERKSGYWTLEEEAWIVWMLYRILTHPACAVRWQNGLYDAQYTYREWNFIPNHGQDTMISQHTLFCAMPKALYFQASMYAKHYVYWKDEGKTWHATQSEDQLWAYNLEDCIYTREVGEVELASIAKLGLQGPHDFQQAFFHPVLKAMLRGLRVRTEKRGELILEVQEAIDARHAMLRYVIGHELNINSNPQLCKFFYEDLQQPKNFNRNPGGMSLTVDDEALTKIGQREPLLKPITDTIADLRTLGKFMEMLTKRLDHDGRMRCSFNIGGSTSGKSAPYSYRLSSSENAFGSGTNLQNIPSDKSMSISKAAQRGTKLQLPNIRSMFGPDPGFTFFDIDLDRADLQVVVWESNDQMLKAALRMGVDIHLLNAFILTGREPPPLEELVESHPKYPDHRGPMKARREFAKRFCHATNYGAGARNLAPKLGQTTHEVDRAQGIWFGAHPGIKEWHRSTEEFVRRHHFIENRFGYRWYIFDRLDGGLPDWLAWKPQSTIGCLINRIWMRIHREAPEIEVLLQIHDSLAGQFPTHRHDACVAKLNQLSQIVIPYEDPLIIPTGVKTSTLSWGDCH